MTDPMRLQSQAVDNTTISCEKRIAVVATSVETDENQTRRDRGIFSVVLLTSTVGNDRVTEMTGFALLAVPSDRVAETIDTFARDAVAGPFVAITRLANGTGYQRVSVVRRGTPVERTNCHV